MNRTTFLSPLLAVVALSFGQAKDAPKGDKAAEKPKDGIELPITPTRKIDFTTEEATWASLDVSPDGKTVVFELLGDLYTMPMEGGQAQLLVHRSNKS